MTVCQACASSESDVLVDGGMQALCNAYPSSLEEYAYQFHVLLGQCKTCGLIQLLRTPDENEIIPKYEWITYSEPEEHLDELSDQLLKLPGLTQDSVFFGITYKDDSTLERLRRRGIKTTWRVSPRDLNITLPNAGSETVLPKLNDESTIKKLIDKNQRPDVIIGRHVLEHAFDTQKFLNAMSVLVKPQGYVVFEVPDCTKNLKEYDYTMIWEEHILYFTSTSFSKLFQNTFFTLFQRFYYPYTDENVMIAVVKNNKSDNDFKKTWVSSNEEDFFGLMFSKNFDVIYKKIHIYFQGLFNQNKKLAIFGAGHISCMFINLFKIKNYISFVVDDDPHKSDLYMPGSLLPIVHSQKLYEAKIDICFMGLSSAAEKKVMNKHSVFLDKKGEFRSLRRLVPFMMGEMV